MHSLECQIQEDDCGSFYRVGSTLAKVPVDAALKASIARTPEGWGESGGKVYAWSPVPSIGWTFVVVAPGSLL